MIVRASLSALAAAGVLLTVSPVVQADSGSITDGGSTPGGMDIHRVHVSNARQLTVTTKVANLRREPGSGSIRVWLDTDRQRRGPEFAMMSGLYDSDYQIARARDWKVVGTGPLNCWIGHSLDARKELISFKVGRDCLGRYGTVRVNVETRGAARDYAPGRHRLSIPFARW